MLHHHTLAVPTDISISDAIKHLRFTDPTPDNNEVRHKMTIKQISDLTGLTKHFIKKAINNHQERKRGVKSKLTDEHIRYLTDNATLKRQKDFTLMERCTLFHRQYPETKISTFTLKSIYKKHHITFK